MITIAAIIAATIAYNLSYLSESDINDIKSGMPIVLIVAQYANGGYDVTVTRGVRTADGGIATAEDPNTLFVPVTKAMRKEAGHLEPALRKAAASYLVPGAEVVIRHLV